MVIRASISVSIAGLFLLVVFLLGIGYPSTGGSLGSTNYNQNFGLPLTAAHDHAVQIGPDTYTDQFTVIPLSMIIDFIIWSAPWYLLLLQFRLSEG
jgi:hypothetical protein